MQPFTHPIRDHSAWHRSASASCVLRRSQALDRGAPPAKFDVDRDVLHGSGSGHPRASDALGVGPCTVLALDGRVSLLREHKPAEVA